MDRFQLRPLTMTTTTTTTTPRDVEIGKHADNGRRFSLHVFLQALSKHDWISLCCSNAKTAQRQARPTKHPVERTDTGPVRAVKSTVMMMAKMEQMEICRSTGTIHSFPRKTGRTLFQPSTAPETGHDQSDRNPPQSGVCFCRDGIVPL